MKQRIEQFKKLLLTPIWPRQKRSGIQHENQESVAVDVIMVGITDICWALNGVSESTVLEWHKVNGLPIERVDGVWCGSKVELEEWLKRRTGQ